MEPGSYVGEVVKAMGKTKILVKVGGPASYLAQEGLTLGNSGEP
jgi:hypothetical protein